MSESKDCQGPVIIVHPHYYMEMGTDAYLTPFESAIPGPCALGMFTLCWKLHEALPQGRMSVRSYDVKLVRIQGAGGMCQLRFSMVIGTPSLVSDATQETQIEDSIDVFPSLEWDGETMGAIFHGLRRNVFAEIRQRRGAARRTTESWFANLGDVE